MKFDDGRVDTSAWRIDVAVASPAVRVGAGIGGLGGLGIIGVLLWLLLGGSGDPTAMLTDSTSAAGGTSAQQASEDLSVVCTTDQALDTRDDCFVLKVFNETNEV